MIKSCPKCQSDTERNAKGDCKPCAKVRDAAYYAANPEKIKVAKAAYYASNPEKARASRAALHLASPGKRKAYNAAYRAANPEKVRACSAAYRAANPEKAKESYSAWKAANPEGSKKRYADNPEKQRAYAVAYRAANPEKVKAGQAAWYAAHSGAWRVHNQNRRARKLENGGTLSKGLSAKLFKLQKGKCPCCKQPLGDDFHLDHIEPIARGGSNTDNNIQLLRAGCNLQKSAKDPIQFMQQRGFLL